MTTGLAPEQCRVGGSRRIIGGRIFSARRRRLSTPIPVRFRGITAKSLHGMLENCTSKLRLTERRRPSGWRRFSYFVRTHRGHSMPSARAAPPGGRAPDDWGSGMGAERAQSY